MSLDAGLEAGASVWIPCDEDVWRPGVVASICSSSGSTSVVVHAHRVDGSTESVEVAQQLSKPGKIPQLLLRNDVLKTTRGSLGTHDLAKLPVLNEGEILHALQDRFHSNVVYTFTGPILIAVNPFCPLPHLYSSSQLREYVNLPVEEEVVVPHIYSISRAAYHGIQKHGLPQTVLVSGESGAGKTESTKFVMQYLALAGAGFSEASMSKIERQVLDSIPLLEALGNAQTLRNHNSSRFGKYIELHFGTLSKSEGARFVGAKMHTYLLEKVRVTGQQKGERNYHIFYQILAAVAREKDTQSSIDKGAVLSVAGVEICDAADLRLDDFSYLKPSAADKSHASSCSEILQRISKDASNNQEKVVEEAQHFDKVLAAFQCLGIRNSDISDVLNAIVAVLHIGNISFKSLPGNSEGSEVDGIEDDCGGFAIACRLLAVDARSFRNACCAKTRKSPGGGVIISAVSVAKAADSRDALARHLYGAIFSFVVTQVNTAFEAGPKDDAFCALPFIGVLDIFGFEFFDHNSFEQLCINFTNELLQQYFNEVIFEHEAALYTREGVQWDPLDFPNNSAIATLIGKPISGILPMLDEECLLVGGNSQRWCDKLWKDHGANKNFKVVKHRQANFTVLHFAGPVEYNSKDFVEKNRDLLSEDLVKCMQASSNSFISERFLQHDRTFGTQEAVNNTTGIRRVTKAQQYSVSSEFRSQLQDLMERIRRTEPHFVRCIKPNPKSVPHDFNRRSVVEQLQYQGVLQAIEVSRAGFPMRLRHRQAVLEYRCLALGQSKIQVEAQLARGKVDVAAQFLFKSLGNGVVPGLSDGSWAVGKTLVFLKKQGVEVISNALSRLRSRTAVVIQAAWRCIQQVRIYRRCRRSAVKIQAIIRSTLAIRRFHRLRSWRAAVRVQRWERGRYVRRQIRRILNAARTIQSRQRTRMCRSDFLRSLHLLRFLQGWLRRCLRKRTVKRRWRAAVTVQRSWRGHSGRRLSKAVMADWHRLRIACRHLLKRWRLKVLARLRQRVCRGGRLAEASFGHLCSTAVMLHEQLAQGSNDIHKLKNNNTLLARQLREMQRWTVQGMFDGCKPTHMHMAIDRDDMTPPFSSCNDAPINPEVQAWLDERIVWWRKASQRHRAARQISTPSPQKRVPSKLVQPVRPEEIDIDFATVYQL